ncbi:zinc finger protein 544-like isoform X2 [Topomyia yanbarensis]|uniref:zinc finger protein 544-like isoform X2 n=1 Tax=Topomyia yanbarensis TaxID=2498891 RepID=UPI00273C255B|nr:zinc finger protein 544-like isoform X2 [Topomyia yanbarensis]
MESTGSSSSSSKGNVEQIKVEPDFYFPIGENYGHEDDDYVDGGDGDEFDDEEEELQFHQIDLDSPVKQKTHTGERPYRCEICNFSSAQSCNLQSHYRRTHGVDPKTDPQLFNQLRQQSSTADSASPTSSEMVPQSSASWAQQTRALPKLLPKPPGQGNQPFKCCVCEEPFFDRDLLLIHEETHVPEAPFECRHCSNIYSILAVFRSHVNLHRVSLKMGVASGNPSLRNPQSGIRLHPNGPVATRKVPTDTTNTNNVLNANQPFVPSNDSQYPYKCVECKENFQKQQLYYHMKVHLKQKNIFSKKSLKCDKCGKVFEKELTLKKHMDTAHPSVSSASSGNPLLLEALQADTRSLSPSTSPSNITAMPSEVNLLPAEVKVKEEEPESSLGDDQVNSTVSDNPILTQLLNTSSELTINPTNSTSRDGSPVDPASTEGGFVISAVATVDHSFLEQLDAMERSQVNQQQQQQPTNEPLVQQMPPLRRMPVLEESLRRPPVTPVNHHTATSRPLNSGPYRCSFCAKVFNEHFGLRQHIRAMHYSEKHHKCKECGKKFTLGITLATHLRIHTAVQPFTCIVCYKTFTRSASLNGHLSSHSYGRVKCAECGEYQINVFNYMKHIEKFHPDFMNNVASYREKAEAVLQRRRDLILEITRGLAKHRSEMPNVLARLRGEVSGMDDTVPKMRIEIKQEQSGDHEEVSSSEQVVIKKERADSSQSEVVSSASEERDLPALRAELRKRPLRSNTCSNDLEELVLPPARKSLRTAANSSPNLKRLLEQDNSSSSEDVSQQEAL